MTQADNVDAAHITHETRGALHPCFGALAASYQDVAVLRQGFRHPAQDSKRPYPALHHRPGEDQTPVLIAGHGTERSIINAGPVQKPAEALEHVVGSSGLVLKGAPLGGESGEFSQAVDRRQEGAARQSMRNGCGFNDPASQKKISGWLVVLGKRHRSAPHHCMTGDIRSYSLQVD